MKKFVLRIRKGGIDGPIVANSQVISITGLGSTPASTVDFSDGVTSGKLVTADRRACIVKKTASPNWAIAELYSSVSATQDVLFTWSTNLLGVAETVNWYAVYPYTNSQFSGLGLPVVSGLISVIGYNGEIALGTTPLTTSQQFQLTLWSGSLGSSRLLARSGIVTIVPLKLTASGPATAITGQQVYVVFTGYVRETVTYSGFTNGTATIGPTGKVAVDLSQGQKVPAGTYTWTAKGNITSNTVPYDVTMIDILGSLVITLPKDGKDGKEGTDGTAGKDGAPGLPAPSVAGQDGKDGKDGKDGVVYYPIGYSPGTPIPPAPTPPTPPPIPIDTGIPTVTDPALGQWSIVTTKTIYSNNEKLVFEVKPPAAFNTPRQFYWHIVESGSTNLYTGSKLSTKTGLKTFSASIETLENIATVANQDSVATNLELIITAEATISGTGITLDGSNDALVRNAYAAIGRGLGTPIFGSETSQIDRAGYDYWINKLATGALTQSSFSAAFNAAIDDFISKNPNDAYSKYIQNFKNTNASKITLYGRSNTFSIAVAHGPDAQYDPIMVVTDSTGKEINPALGVAYYYKISGAPPNAKIKQEIVSVDPNYNNFDNQLFTAVDANGTLVVTPVYENSGTTGANRPVRPQTIPGETTFKVTFTGYTGTIKNGNSRTLKVTVGSNEYDLKILPTDDTRDKKKLKVLENFFIELKDGPPGAKWDVLKSTNAEGISFSGTASGTLDNSGYYKSDTANFTKRGIFTFTFTFSGFTGTIRGGSTRVYEITVDDGTATETTTGPAQEFDPQITPSDKIEDLIVFRKTLKTEEKFKIGIINGPKNARVDVQKSSDPPGWVTPGVDDAIAGFLGVDGTYLSGEGIFTSAGTYTYVCTFSGFGQDIKIKNGNTRTIIFNVIQEPKLIVIPYGEGAGSDYLAIKPGEKGYIDLSGVVKDKVTITPLAPVAADNPYMIFYSESVKGFLEKYPGKTVNDLKSAEAVAYAKEWHTKFGGANYSPDDLAILCDNPYFIFNPTAFESYKQTGGNGMSPKDYAAADYKTAKADYDKAKTNYDAKVKYANQFKPPQTVAPFTRTAPTTVDAANKAYKDPLSGANKSVTLNDYGRLRADLTGSKKLNIRSLPYAFSLKGAATFNTVTIKLWVTEKGGQGTKENLKTPSIFVLKVNAKDDLLTIATKERQPVVLNIEGGQNEKITLIPIKYNDICGGSSPATYRKKKTPIHPYMQLYPDVAKYYAKNPSGNVTTEDADDHWKKYGKNEGRISPWRLAHLVHIPYFAYNSAAESAYNSENSGATTDSDKFDVAKAKKWVDAYVKADKTRPTTSSISKLVSDFNGLAKLTLPKSLDINTGKLEYSYVNDKIVPRNIPYALLIDGDKTDNTIVLILAFGSLLLESAVQIETPGPDTVTAQPETPEISKPPIPFKLTPITLEVVEGTTPINMNFSGEPGAEVFATHVDISTPDNELYMEYYPDVLAFYEENKNTSLKDFTKVQAIEAHYNIYGKNEGRKSPNDIIAYHKPFRNEKQTRGKLFDLSADKGTYTLDLSGGGAFPLMARKSPYTWKLENSKSSEVITFQVTIKPKAGAADASTVPKVTLQTFEASSNILRYSVQGSFKTNIKSISVNAIYGTIPELVGAYNPPSNPSTQIALYPGSSFKPDYNIIAKFLNRICLQVLYRNLSKEEVDTQLAKMTAVAGNRSIFRSFCIFEKDLNASEEKRLIENLQELVTKNDFSKLIGTGKKLFDYPADGINVVLDSGTQVLHGVDMAQLDQLQGDFTLIIIHTITDKNGKNYSTVSLPPYPIKWRSQPKVTATDNEKITGFTRPVLVTKSNNYIYSAKDDAFKSPVILLSATAKSCRIDGGFTRIEMADNMSAYSWYWNVANVLSVKYNGVVVLEVENPGTATEWVFKDGKLWAIWDILGGMGYRFEGLTQSQTIPQTNAGAYSTLLLTGADLLTTDKSRI